jgi:Flp pilus assembly protein TadG
VRAGLFSLFTSRLTALRADERGGPAIEFAFIAPILLTFVIGIVEVAMTLFAWALLEGGVREAARYGITGYTVTGQSREAMVKAIVGKYSVGMFDLTKVKVTSLTYKTFTNIGQPEPFTDTNHNGTRDAGEAYTDVNGNGKWDADMGAPGVGGPGDVVVYTATYDWPLMTGYMSGVMALKIPLSASYAVRNEPWVAGTTP